MLTRSIALYVVLLSGPAYAQGLTSVECAAIQAAYGVVPSECSGAPATPAMIAPITAPTEDMRQNNIFFTQGGAELDTNALLQIKRLADALNTRQLRRTCLRLVGHSDSSGGAIANMEMGAKRASAVQNRLSLLLDNPARIEAVISQGEDAPLSGLPTNSPWQRRVELWARHCEGT